jgi:hypothetical protein
LVEYLFEAHFVQARFRVERIEVLHQHIGSL